MSKDLSLADSAAKQLQLGLPLTTLANRIYQKLESDHEFSELDFSVVYDWLKRANQGLKKDSYDDVE